MPNVKIYHGDCLEVLRGLPEGSVSAVVTDPPAGIGFMNKAFDTPVGFREMLTRALAESLRVAKPGAHLLCWALPRTSHWTGVAIEEAGWQIQDRIAHVFGSGFPKHKSKLKPAAEDWWLATKPGPKWLGVDACRIPTDENLGGGAYAKNGTARHDGDENWRFKRLGDAGEFVQPEGRWPANFVLSHSDECEQVGERQIKGDRLGDPGGKRDGGFFATGSDSGDGKPNARVYGDETVGVWNCHPECPVRLLDEQTGTLKSGSRKAGEYGCLGGHGRLNEWSEGPIPEVTGDSGGASRFFAVFPGEASRFRYCAKASKKDRDEGCEGLPERSGGVGCERPSGSMHERYGDKNGSGSSPRHLNTHPTVKSTNLMRWLCRLVCPEGGTILDPFMGSGSTGKACVLEGFRFIGIEQDAEYVEIARRRIEAEVRKRDDEMPLFRGEES